MQGKMTSLTERYEPEEENIGKGCQAGSVIEVFRFISMYGQRNRRATQGDFPGVSLSHCHCERSVTRGCIVRIITIESLITEEVPTILLPVLSTVVLLVVFHIGIRFPIRMI
jgi:hypothetical protein